jgi:CheY-like chemotaxis protein
MALLADGVPIAVLDLQYFIQPITGETQPFATSSAEYPPLKILLVDDSRITREMFRRILADGGAEVEAVASGDEALSVLRARTVDCIVTDIEMPGIDGLELTRRVRGCPEWEHLPVVVVSTRDQPADRMAGLEAGADAYLAKQNLMGEQLVALVQRLGGRR